MRALHLLALAALLPLAACGDRTGERPAPGEDASAPTTLLGKLVEHGTHQAREALANRNYPLSGGSGVPKAEITPQGDLVIDGTPVNIDPAQRELLLAHRAHMAGIGEAGIAIGIEGADLGVKAATEALRSVFSGNPDQVEERIKAQTQEIENSVQALCDRLPALLASQRTLAAALPEFAPYARMDESDIEDCGKDGRIVLD